jgi:sugar transferase (PEP-CTERM system associated)
MVRIFRHYLSARLILIVGLEAMVFVLAIRLGLAFNLPGAHASDALALLPTIAFVIGMLVVMNATGLYSGEQWADMQAVRLRLMAAAVLVVVLILAVSRMPPSMTIEPYGFAVTGVAIFVGVTAVRYAFYRWGDIGALKTRVLVLGTGPRVTEFAQLAQRNRNYQVIGYVALPAATEHCVPSSMILPLGPDQSLAALARKHRIDQIVLAATDRRGKLPLQELLECKLQGLKIVDLPTAFEREYRQVSLESITPGWVMFEDGFSQGVLRTALKRGLDLAVSAAMLLVALPIIVIAGVCIFLESGAPIFYRQERVGQGGRTFSMYKLRSMRQDAEGDGKPRWASAQDDRTTAVGRVIRKLRIDELPQIINVFKGDMSFIGPRPERPFFVDQLVKEIPYYWLRHTIKPGITGWAQVCYPYGASIEETTEKLKYDLYYVKNHALFLDLVILLATIEVVFTGKGAR